LASDELHIVRESGNIIYDETLIGNNLLPANDISIGSHPAGINGLRGNLHEPYKISKSKNPSFKEKSCQKCRT